MAALVCCLKYYNILVILIIQMAAQVGVTYITLFWLNLTLQMAALIGVIIIILI